MESCLKKLVLEAAATGFQDPEKGGCEPVGHLGENNVLGGLDWREAGVYLQPPEGQKTNSGLIGARWGSQAALQADTVRSGERIHQEIHTPSAHVRNENDLAKLGRT